MPAGSTALAAPPGAEEDGDAKGWAALFAQQCGAMMWKNFILSWRSRRATFLQLFSSFFFIFLIFCFDQAVRVRWRSVTVFKNIMDPEQKALTAIPSCSQGYNVKPGCYDFLYSPMSDNLVKDTVRAIMENNGKRKITTDNVLGFESAAAVDEWLLANPFRAMGALLFHNLTKQDGSQKVVACGSVERRLLGYGLQTNSTAKVNKRGDIEDANFMFQLPMQMAVERELARGLLRDCGVHNSIAEELKWDVSFSEFAHPAQELFSPVGTAGPFFLFAAAMFGFVVQMTALVRERELKLRQAMSTMGAFTSAYWVTWLAWEIALSVISSLFIVIFGMVFQFPFFLKNDLGVQFFHYFLFSLSMIGFAFMLSAFISKSSSAINVGFFVYIIGFLTLIVTMSGFPYEHDFSSKVRFFWSLFPPNSFSLGLKYMGDSTATKEDDGIKWRDRGKQLREDHCYSMAQIWNHYIISFFVFFTLAIYLDNVVPDPNGVRKPYYYFLTPAYWLGQGSTTEGGGCCTWTKRLSSKGRQQRSGGTERGQEGGDGAEEDMDVKAEEALVMQQASSGRIGSDVAVQLRGLVKAFPRKTTLKCGCCCRCRLHSTPEFHAVKGSWFNIEKGKLFCLLGPNGAGKTTTINCLTGVIPTTSGDALVYGDSIRDPSGMNRIRKRMGVCPQFDILWDTMTGREHLWMFASIKGMRKGKIAAEADQLLQKVRLTEAGNMRSASYSGGMKRRLSVAIAMIGDPAIVYLDEPTTGMDPISRRHVWDIIESAKAGRAIVLTTHSMEEADVLGDRIAIMAKGKLRCIGTSIHLKSRFGEGYIVNISVRKAAAAAAANGGGERRGAGNGAVAGGKNVAGGHEEGGQGERENGESVEGRQRQEEEEEAGKRVRAFFKTHLDVEATEDAGAYIKFLVSRKKEDALPDFFRRIDEAKEQLGVTDLQLSLSTMEEVFLRIARRAELESAAAEGRYEKVVLPNDQIVNVPVGAEAVLIPDSATAEAPYGLMIDLTWQQDDQGCLKVASFSLPRAAPASLQVAAEHLARANVLQTVGSFSRRRMGSFDNPMVGEAVSLPAGR
ncbi:hypothetical protein CBR_g8373 [Chara braunii]|uniref:ABC transporter domain-containing protein n=1 Tax=Chara braunii TaxID=69332 RepID=A0A388KLY6_CHABU|nr:hypothetical protein CBR_g8373 [Chara braunii]|eukprot:GBG71074.1 hypothetical protein CBR_g8373 [Chara braunii]